MRLFRGARLATGTPLVARKNNAAFATAQLRRSYPVTAVGRPRSGPERHVEDLERFSVGGVAAAVSR